MSVTRAEDRPGRSHVPPTPPAKLAPADDPAWAHTLALAALARDARFALAFFQLNQTERVTAEVDDDHLRVYLDDDVEWAQQFRPDRKGQTDG